VEESVKIVGKTKKSVFTADENKVLLIGLAQCPKPPVLKKAVTEYDEYGKNVSEAQIGTLCRIWPKETNLPDLLEDQPGEDEEWDKGEAYMVQLADMPTIHQRLKVMKFKTEWVEEAEIPKVFHTRIMNAYKQIETNKYFLQMISYTLAIGNVLNGGGPKGQSDGFEMSVFSKIAQMKDNTNQTMMQFILKKIYAQDPGLHQGVKELYKSVNIKEVDVKYIKTKTQELNTMFTQHKACFTEVENEGDHDSFILRFREVIEKA